MATYEYAKTLIVDTLASLPTSGLHGTYAHVKDTNRLYFWNGSAWVTVGAGSGGSVRPPSLWNQPSDPHVSDDEFESAVLGWTRTVSGTTCAEGTISPLSSVTPDCIQDLHGSWPSWLLLQSDESSLQTVSYTKSYTPATNATIWIGAWVGNAAASIGTGETAIVVKCYNSSDTNEYARFGFNTPGAGQRSVYVEVSNNGALSASQSSNFGTAYSVVGMYKSGEGYRGFAMQDNSGGILTPASVTKTGVASSTFDKIEITFYTDNQTPSVVMGIDFIRFLDSTSFGIRNP